MTDTRIDFRYLSEPDLIEAGVTDVAACVDVMEEMFRLVGVGDYRMGGADANSHGIQMAFPTETVFAGMPVDGPDRRFVAMPAYLGGSFQMAGMKWYGSNVENREKGLPRSIHVIVLNDKDTGAPIAVMSGNLISAYRTGALPGVGARHLARPGASVVGLVGPGVINRTTLESYLVVCPEIELVKVKGRSAKSTQVFVDEVAAQFPQLTVEVVDSMEAAVRDSDLVSVVISTDLTGGAASYPHVRTEWVKPGALFTCPGAVRFDEEFVTAPRTRRVVDNIKLYESWMHDLPRPAFDVIPLPGVQFMDLVESGSLTRDSIVDFPAVVAGQVEGRRSDDECVIYSVGGMPVEDVAWATHLLRRAESMGLGTPLNLWDSPALR